jgi:hypothetical protein
MNMVVKVLSNSNKLPAPEVECLTFMQKGGEISAKAAEDQNFSALIFYFSRKSSNNTYEILPANIEF